MTLCHRVDEHSGAPSKEAAALLPAEPSWSHAMPHPTCEWAYEDWSAPNVSVTSWVSMYSRTSWINPLWNRKTQQ